MKNLLKILSSLVIVFLSSLVWAQDPFDDPFFDDVDMFFQKQVERFKQLESDPFVQDFLSGSHNRLGLGSSSIKHETIKEGDKIKVILTPPSDKTELKIVVEDSLIKASGEVIEEIEDEQTGSYSRRQYSVSSTLSVPQGVNPENPNIEKDKQGRYIITFKSGSYKSIAPRKKDTPVKKPIKYFESDKTI